MQDIHASLCAKNNINHNLYLYLLRNKMHQWGGGTLDFGRYTDAVSYLYCWVAPWVGRSDPWGHLVSRSESNLRRCCKRNEHTITSYFSNTH